jgi:hypothetical protein
MVRRDPDETQYIGQLVTLAQFRDVVRKLMIAMLVAGVVNIAGLLLAYHANQQAADRKQALVLACQIRAAERSALSSQERRRMRRAVARTLRAQHPELLREDGTLDCDALANAKS